MELKLFVCVQAVITRLREVVSSFIAHMLFQYIFHKLTGVVHGWSYDHKAAPPQRHLLCISFLLQLKQSVSTFQISNIFREYTVFVVMFIDARIDVGRTGLEARCANLLRFHRRWICEWGKGACFACPLLTSSALTLQQRNHRSGDKPRVEPHALTVLP